MFKNLKAAYRGLLRNMLIPNGKKIEFALYLFLEILFRRIEF